MKEAYDKCERDRGTQPHQYQARSPVHSQRPKVSSPDTQKRQKKRPIARTKNFDKTIQTHEKMQSPTNVRKTSPVPIPGRAANKPQSSGGSPFAGAKFSDPPSPKSLPKPPTHWVQPTKTALWESAVQTNSDEEEKEDDVTLYDQIAAQLKILLKVPN